MIEGDRELINTFNKEGNLTGFSFPILKVIKWLIVRNCNWKWQPYVVSYKFFGMSCLVVFGRCPILFCIHTRNVNSACHINFTAVGSSSHICLRECKTDRLKRGSTLYGDKTQQRGWKRKGRKRWCCGYLTQLPATRPPQASKVFCNIKLMGWTAVCVWPTCSLKANSWSYLGSGFRRKWRSGFKRPTSHPVRKHFQETGTALAYSPFINIRPSEFPLITHPRPCQAFRSDFKSIWGRLILKGLCWTETTLLLRKHRLHSSQCNYWARRFPAAWRWTYRGAIRTPGITFCPVSTRWREPDLTSPLVTSAWSAFSLRCFRLRHRSPPE